MAIGRKIKRYREQNKLKQSELAALLGMSQSNFSRIENDEINADEETITKLAEIFKTDPETLATPELEIDRVVFNGCNQVNFKENVIHNYTISEDLKNLYEKQIFLLEEKIKLLEEKISTI